MACENCIDNYPSSCITWQGDTSFGCDLHSIIKKLVENNSDLEVDLKTLSESDDLSNDQIIQVLVDSIVRLNNQVKELNTTTAKTIDCSLSLNGTPSNNICTILTFILNEINSLKIEVTNLKNNNEYM